MSQVLGYGKLLQKLMEIDENIRFTSVFDMEGKIISSMSKDGVDPYFPLTKQKKRSNMLYQHGNQE